MAEERAAKRPRYENPPPSQSSQRPSDKAIQIPIIANYFRVQVGLNQNIIQYDVKIQPTLEKYQLISRLLRPHEKVTGPLICNKLTAYCLTDFDNKVLESEFQGKQYTITLTKVKTISKTDSAPIYFQVFNSAFKRILQNSDGFVPLGRKGLFDKSQRIPFDRFRFEIWPGYMTTLSLSSMGEILICSSLAFKIMRKETCYDVISKSDSRRDEVSLRGSIVLTSYGRKDRTYRIKEIKRDMNPDSTFLRKGEKITFRQYFKEVYNEEIRHRDQPLLLAESATERRQKRQNIALTEEVQDLYLIPELCTLTGMTDDMRSDRDLMGAVSKVTRIAAGERLRRLEDFMKKFSRPSNPQIKKYLSDWKIQVDDRPLEFAAKQLAPKDIIFGNNASFKKNDKAEWSAFWKDKLQFIDPKPLRRWFIVYNDRDQVALNNLLRFLPKIASEFGISVDSNPPKYPLHNDQVRDWMDALSKNVQGMDFVVCILPRNTADKYNSIKQFLTTQVGIPSQCVVARTLQDDKVQSAITKIVQQINSKMGGPIWKLDIDLPPTPTMVCGIDICHDKLGKRGSVAGFVATMNKDLNSFFSKTLLLRREADLVTGLTGCMVEAIDHFKKVNGVIPSQVIVYRDGVGDGQLPEVREREIKELREGLEQQKLKISLIFIVVQKKINTRLFRPGRDRSNPPPGTVVDSHITSPIRGVSAPEFYLIPQFVQASATVCPSHYIVLENDLGADLQTLEILTFSLCHLYYNWSGTIRVPAPVQYATKLSFHVSQHLGSENHRNLSTKLFYL